VDLLDRMLGHDYWATNLLLEHCAALTGDQLDQQFDIGIGSIRPTMTHMINTLEFWSSQMENRPMEMERDAVLTVAEQASLHERNHARFTRAAHAALNEDRLDEIFTDIHGYPQSRGATILQTMYHNTWHRSEVRHMLERLGVSEIWDGDPQEWEYIQRQSNG
jgi:uncharacterized damage-inducible protein DinB